MAEPIAVENLRPGLGLELVTAFCSDLHAGLSVGLVSILYNQGGFDLMLKAIAGLSLLTVVGAVIFPKEKRAI